MARLKGLTSFVVISAGVFLGLRGLHLGVPLLFPETRQGPIEVTRIEDVGRQVGFAPLAPAYRPSILGERPERMTVWLSPTPTFQIVWRGAEHDLSVTQRRGGPGPDFPPLARAFEDLPDATWWITGTRQHLVLKRDGFWIELETSLPPRELRRFADTLTAY
jgi:hypothetical protein